MVHGTHLLWAYASDCYNGWAVSYANLGITDFAFTSSVPSFYVAQGWMSQGEGTLTEDNQKLTVRNRGYCGHTYAEESPYRPEHLIPIEFI